MPISDFFAKANGVAVVDVNQDGFLDVLFCAIEGHPNEFYLNNGDGTFTESAAAFGIDEPMGCYDDLENADAFVLWGSNMAEMHPILWTRIADRRLSHPHVKVAVLSTFEHRSFDLADIPGVFVPQTDLIIANYIANHIIQSGAVNEEFVSNHVNFRKGAQDIGYGLRPENPLEAAAAKMAGRIAGLPPRAIDLTKRLLNESWTNTLDEQLEAEAFAQETAGLTRDHFEGVTAFLEKRQPAFTGE